MPQTEPRVARSVLFVDFDNMGLSIKKTDEVLANAFARAPQVWVDALERGELIDDDGLLAPRRRFLMKRCYANPRLIDPYRANFTWAGFQVVDCPPLTGGGKNSADIYMVMDVLDALEHKTPFDEFFILSSDADFTPVLTRLTAHDRRTVIFANQVTAQAYKTMCDGLIPEPALMDLLAKTVEYARRERSRQAAPANYTPAPAPSYHPAPQAPAPQVPLPQATQPRDAEVAERAEAPLPAAMSAPLPSQRPRVPPIPDRVRPMARAIAEETDVPYLAPLVYAEMFKAIADEVNEKGFSLNKTVKGVHERIEAATGWGIYPKYIAFVLKGIQFTGLDLASGEVTAADLAKAFQRQVIRLAGRAGMELTEPDRKNVAWWMRSALPRVVTPTDPESPAEPADDVSAEPAETGRPIEDADALVDASEAGDLDTLEAARRDGADIDGDDDTVSDELGTEELGTEELGPEDLENAAADPAAPLVDDDALVTVAPDADPRDGDPLDAEGPTPAPDADEAIAGPSSADQAEPVEALDANDDDIEHEADDHPPADPDRAALDPAPSTPPRRGWWQVSPAAPISPLARPPADAADAGAEGFADTGLADPAERTPEPAVKPLVDSGDELDRILEQLRSIGLSPPAKSDAP